MNVVERMVDAVNRRDLAGIEAAFHPDVEVTRSRATRRGFTGRAEEMTNWTGFVSRYPTDGRLEILGMLETPTEIWVENCFTNMDSEQGAIVTFNIDPDTDTIIRMCYLLSRSRKLR